MVAANDRHRRGGATTGHRAVRGGHHSIGDGEQRTARPARRRPPGATCGVARESAWCSCQTLHLPRPRPASAIATSPSARSAVLARRYVVPASPAASHGSDVFTRSTRRSLSARAASIASRTRAQPCDRLTLSVRSNSEGSDVTVKPRTPQGEAQQDDRAMPATAARILDVDQPPRHQDVATSQELASAQSRSSSRRGRLATIGPRCDQYATTPPPHSAERRATPHQPPRDSNQRKCRVYRALRPRAPMR